MEMVKRKNLTAEEKVERLNSLVSALVVLTGALVATHPDRSGLRSLLTTSGGKSLMDSIAGDDLARKTLERLLSVDR